MKKISLVLLMVISINPAAFSQGKLPVIKASSTSAVIVEGSAAEQTDWWINPKIKPDVHVMTKSPKPKWVTFRTDTDSIKVKIRPGQRFDFIVLLNGKDSCYTRIESRAAITRFIKQSPPSHDTIPFILTDFNNIKLKVCLNHTDTLYLKFDSGATGLLLTHEAIAQKTSLLAGQTGVKEGLKKPDYSKMSPYNTLKMGNLRWDSLDIYPVVLSGQGTDGRFGWDLFDGRVVEIDYDRRLFIIHSALPGKRKGYAKLPVIYSNGLFCIEGTQKVKGKKYTNRFLFDSGYQRTIMLDSTLMAGQKFPTDLKVIKKTIMQNGQGKNFPVITVNNEQLVLGKTTLPDIPAQILTTSNPAGFQVHILGNEVLKRFNTIIDFQRNHIYLKPNGLINLPYTDGS